MNASKEVPAPRERHDRLLREWVHDPYKSKSKPPEPTVCHECGAVFTSGRWQWAEAPDGAHEGLCPACQRIRDRVPAGILTLSGPFLREHREEILNLVRNTEEREKAQHPLKRIMAVEEGDEETVITFTDPHLARGTGTALHHAWQGDLDYHYLEEEMLLRVHWRR
jgi:NMD protein affecting ribosome stability and mRNA decay